MVLRGRGPHFAWPYGSTATGNIAVCEMVRRFWCFSLQQTEWNNIVIVGHRRISMQEKVGCAKWAAWEARKRHSYVSVCESVRLTSRLSIVQVSMAHGEYMVVKASI